MADAAALKQSLAQKPLADAFDDLLAVEEEVVFIILPYDHGVEVNLVQLGTDLHEEAALEADQLGIDITELDDLLLVVAQLKAAHPVGDGLVMRLAEIHWHYCVDMLADQAEASVAKDFCTRSRDVGNYTEVVLYIGLNNAGILGVEAAVDGLLP